jgi:hypothetical protein
MASRKKSKGVKLIALLIVVLMVVAFLTTGIYALFGGGGNGVAGTYIMTDGSKMVLDASGNATLTVPGSNDAATTTYTAEDDKVTLLDPKTGGALITFTRKGNTLVSNAGTQPEVWTKQ